MGTHALEIVRFRGRYYIYWHQYDGYYEGLGAKIVADIPADPEEYKKWLEQMRAKYAAKQSALEEHVYEIRDGSGPAYDQFHDLMALPSELQRLNYYDDNYSYIINLDCEVLTINPGVHWKLGHIPRKNNLWMNTIRQSIYQGRLTISLDLCPEEYIASPALELPEPNRILGYKHHNVTPKLDIREARKAFLTRVMAEVLIKYKDDIFELGMEWSPASFPFRELAFAFVSIASGAAGFFSFPTQKCDARCCLVDYCQSNHLPKSCGFLNKEWAGNHAPLLEFGSMSHRPGDAPGVSPAETMYWFEDVLVSLTLRHDGGAITQAVSWGLDQGRRNFLIVVLSLFKVTLAEVSCGEGEDDEPSVKVCRPVYLSPLRRRYCMSTHPRERPELKPGMKLKRYEEVLTRERGGLFTSAIGTQTVETLRSHYPGFAALVNFFEVAANRRTVSKSAGILPPELYDQVLEFVDYDTWKTCASVSTELRYSCLRKYRVDDKTRIVAGPFLRLRGEKHLLSFKFEDMQTGQVFPVIESPRLVLTKALNWIPLIGGDRKALMLDVVVEFEPAEDIPVRLPTLPRASISRATQPPDFHTYSLP